MTVPRLDSSLRWNDIVIMLVLLKTGYRFASGSTTLLGVFYNVN